MMRAELKRVRVGLIDKIVMMIQYDNNKLILKSSTYVKEGLKRVRVG